MSEQGNFSLEQFTPATFIADHIPHLLISFFCVIVTYPMMSILGIGPSGCIAVMTVETIGIIVVLTWEYLRKRRYYQNAITVAQAATAAIFFPEMIGEAAFLEGRIMSETIEQMGNLAMSESTADKKDMEQYREYVELWIHEIKTPLAAMKLIQSSMHGAAADKLAKEIERIEVQVEQALYYARTTSLENDYRLKEIDLTHAIRSACKKNMRTLIAQAVTLHVDIPDTTKVVADEQWLVFIVSQIISNSAKYGARNLTFTTSEEKVGTPHEHTKLNITDDGMGIPASDLSKVFDRGFTGINGRTLGSSTGMGLYLVASMAKRMGVGLSLTSEPEVGTCVHLAFPHDRRRATR